MTFHSILFLNADHTNASSQAREPSFFGDLNHDQIVSAVTAPKQEYDLKSFFYILLNDTDAVNFRHEVVRDLEVPDVMRIVKAFAYRMRTVREHLVQSEKRRNPYQKMHWFLEAAVLYGKTVENLVSDLNSAEVKSRGLQAFREYVTGYAASQRFTTPNQAAQQLLAELNTIRYSILIQGLCVEVRPYQGEPDYGAEVASLFERFERDAAHTYSFEFGDFPDINTIEANILRLVAQTHREVFDRLEHYCGSNKDFQDAAMVRFDREVQFYIAYLDHIAPLKKAGLNFCYPHVSQIGKNTHVSETFDLALAGKLLGKGTIPISNDFRLNGPERIIVITGPNQGGKTTFARTFGQLHYLASLGLPVPGSKAQLYMPDHIFTHFERAEHTTNLTGKLQEDLVRIHEVLEDATPQSVIIINEIFTSTTLQDAISLSQKVATTIMEHDALCAWVTFIDEVATLSEKTVSMVATVTPEEPEQRTFKIVRQPPNCLAYAMAIARKFRLTSDAIRERMVS